MNMQFEELLDLGCVEVTNITIEKCIIHIHCQSKMPDAYCPHCLAKKDKINQTQVRQIRDLPILGKKVFLHLTSRQFICYSCNRYYYERFDFVESSETVTKRYSESIFKLCNGIELQHVVVLEDLCWQTVNRIVCKYGSRQIKKRKAYARVRRI